MSFNLPEIETTWKTRLKAFWLAWKYVLVLGLLLVGSLWGNLHQYGTARSAKAECKSGMKEAALIAIQNERERAAKADKQAGEIADKAKGETANAVAQDEGNTNGRSRQLEAVVVRGGCYMPAGVPDLTPAVREANAAAGITLH